MAEKVLLKVLINGKMITVAGYEEEEYLQNISNYINRKISGFSENLEYRRMTSDMKNTLLTLNIADDYFKAKKRAEILEESIEAGEQDAYGLKQDLVSAQMEADRLRLENDSLKQELEKLKNRYDRNSGSGRL